MAIEGDGAQAQAARIHDDFVDNIAEPKPIADKQNDCQDSPNIQQKHNDEIEVDACNGGLGGDSARIAQRAADAVDEQAPRSRGADVELGDMESRDSGTGPQKTAATVGGGRLLTSTGAGPDTSVVSKGVMDPRSGTEASAPGPRIHRLEGEIAPPAANAHTGEARAEQGGPNGDLSHSRPVPTRPRESPLSEWPAHCDPTYRMPDELDVKADVDGDVRSMTIKIERFNAKKIFEGGHRNKLTGKVFHHASSQFGQREVVVKRTSHLRSRDTQTCRTTSTTMQTTNECGTQMGRNDMYLDDSRDTFKIVGEYQTAAQYWRIREREAIVIQCYWRGFAARKKVWCRRAEKWANEEEEAKLEAEKERQKAHQQQREIQRRMNPSTVQDFEILYNELEQWREAETKRIKATEGGQRRQLSLRELLHKETRLLQTIDRLKITAAKEGQERRTRRMLDLMSAPKQWEMGDGQVAEIHTPWTGRARELQELYEALEAPLLTVEERLDVLLHLKWTVSEFDCRLTRDITELVDREADLLSRGRKEPSLRPLRQRIRSLFLRFAETPDFNPEATRFVRVPPKYDKLTDEGVAGLTAVSCT